MLLVAHGFTPRQIETEFSWKEVEMFMTCLEHFMPDGGE
jgi:hypothetical protein